MHWSEKKVAVFGAGGLRNALFSGILRKAKCVPSMFSKVYAVSSAAMLAAYFISGKLHLTDEIWVKRLMRPEVYDGNKRLFSMDLEYMVKIACHDLDRSFFRSGYEPKLIVPIVDAKTGEVEYHQINDENFDKLLMQTCHIPSVANRRKILDRSVLEKVDGAIRDPLPVQKASEENPDKKIIVFSNVPVGYVKPLPSVWMQLLAFVMFPKLWFVFRKHPDYQRETWEFIAKHQISVIAPQEMPAADTFERDPKKVEATIRLGEQIGERHAALFL
ncbi:MAG: hypothetical protein HY453_00130 [Parcubacteria group bacterium]|nr:hypothetical protein [Parcubacteria group bacterium]